MERNISVSSREEFILESLFRGLHSGSVLEHKELLDSLGDVNVRGNWRRTLLHISVWLGKPDWVEELLVRGADPSLVDGTGLNAISSAEERFRRFPNDLNRLLVLKLVTLAHMRNQEMMHHLQSISSHSAHSKRDVGSPNPHFESLNSSVDSLRQQMKSLVRELHSSLEELKAQVSGRDIVLRSVEEAVTSVVEDVGFIKLVLRGKAGVWPSLSDRATARQECVDAMLERTIVKYGDGSNIMRKLYERLYDEDDGTACIVKCLSGYDRVKVVVDCGSENIERMKNEVVLLDCTQESGREWNSFCDLQSETVYLGAKVTDVNSEINICAWLAWALSQLCLKLVFENEWMPYSKGDVEREYEWMRCLQEVEKKTGEEISFWLTFALERRTQHAQIFYLAAAIPRIIALHGFKEGRAILQEEAPLLHAMYFNFVMPTMLANTRR